MRTGTVLLAVAIAVGTAILQSTVLGFIGIRGVHPDLVLVVVVFVANRNGSLVGELTGFGAGLALDLIGSGPLGLYALIYTVIGASFGITRGKMFVDPVFMPALFAVAALLIKGLLALLLGGLYGIEGLTGSVLSPSYAIEIAYSAVSCPIVFGLLKLVSPLQPDRRRGEGF